MIVGFTYESTDVPVYARVEYDAADTNGNENQIGGRVGYKLSNGAKIQAQYFRDEQKDTYNYLKLICLF